MELTSADVAAVSAHEHQWEVLTERPEGDEEEEKPHRKLYCACGEKQISVIVREELTSEASNAPQ